MSRAESTLSKKKERVQLDFSTEALERLDELKEKTGASTRAEVVRQALRLYEWFVNETEPNSTIRITNSQGETTSMFKAFLLNSAMHSR